MAEIEIADPAAPGSVPRLGRLPAVDERDRRFSMAAPPSQRTFRNWLSPGEIWDQGQTPQCVSYATNRFLTTHRIVNDPPMSFTAFYDACQLNDEWEGSAYDGTSVRAGFKVLKDLGYITSYGWASESEQIIRHILEIGPVVVGFDWTDQMFDPDATGYIWPKGQIVGGHAFLLTCANTLRLNPDGSNGAVRMLNSWGPGWGTKGKAWLSNGSLEALLAGLDRWPGEAATAIEIDITP